MCLWRTDLRVVLVSPVGTRSVLAVPHGDTHPHYTGWTFTSVRHWGENPMGVWKLILSDEIANNAGAFLSFPPPPFPDPLRTTRAWLLTPPPTTQGSSTEPSSPCADIEHTRFRPELGLYRV
jgi:kexin